MDTGNPRLGVAVVASAIVWIAILLGCRAILDNQSTFLRLVPILGGGAVFFVLLLPAALLARR